MNTKNSYGPSFMSNGARVNTQNSYHHESSPAKASKNILKKAQVSQMGPQGINAPHL